jgi:hypothetical protein
MTSRTSNSANQLDENEIMRQVGFAEPDRPSR